jgi:ferredoxin
VSHDHSGKSSLERHNEEMKVGGFSRWLFGPGGGTQLPVYETPKHAHHDEPHVSAEFKGFFKDSPESTDSEYQKIRRERTVSADLSQINIPDGYVPVTFVEDDIIVVAEKGANLRQICLDNGVPLYSDVMTLLNCRGLGLCTSCRVSVDPNDGVSQPNAMEKVHLIRDNPKYRLACQCEVTGPVKVSTKPARDYGIAMRNFVTNAGLFGVFSLIMLLVLLVIGFDVVGKWF